MNSKWYISTLIILLALIGLNQEQAKVANQQIVLQFTDAEMTSETSHNDALTTVAKKLQVLGIADIEIIESDATQLRIRYYSDVDALSVAEFLSQDSELSLASKDVGPLPIDSPKDELPETCSIVVSDLHEQTDGLGLNGRLAFELNQDYQRFYNPVILRFNDAIGDEQDALVQIAYRINRDIAIALDNTSQTIPEVRAGPYIFGNS